MEKRLQKGLVAPSLKWLIPSNYFGIDNPQFVFEHMQYSHLCKNTTWRLEASESLFCSYRTTGIIFADSAMRIPCWIEWIQMESCRTSWYWSSLQPVLVIMIVEKNNVSNDLLPNFWEAVGYTLFPSGTAHLTKNLLIRGEVHFYISYWGFRMTSQVNFWKMHFSAQRWMYYLLSGIRESPS